MITPTPPPEADRITTMKPTDPVAAPLLPCPLCGAEAIISDWTGRQGGPGNYSQDIVCTKCSFGICGHDSKGRTNEEIVHIWNTRTPLPPRADWALEKAQLESQILVLQARLGQGQEEPQGQLASEAQKALASLQENPKWTQWVNAVYSEPRFNAPHRMSHVRALEMAALLFLRHAPAAPDAQDGERLDWIEAHGYVLQQYINNAGKTLWLVINEDQRIPADSRILGEAPTLRAALDEARGQKE